MGVPVVVEASPAETRLWLGSLPTLLSGTAMGLLALAPPSASLPPALCGWEPQPQLSCYLG
jgi:hypothetical protein